MFSVKDRLGKEFLKRKILKEQKIILIKQGFMCRAGEGLGPQELVTLEKHWEYFLSEKKGKGNSDERMNERRCSVTSNQGKNYIHST